MENQTFQYSYSKEKADEVEKIRDKYLDQQKELTNYEKIKQLDKNTTKTATIVALIVGIISSLVLGTGMCCVMVWDAILFGIIIGIVGIIGALVTYPIYQALVDSVKEKVKSEILSLCDEALNKR